jgi:hypothetical protein
LEERTNRLDQKEDGCLRGSEKQTEALEKIDVAIEALRGCKGELSAEGYVQLRKRIGHLMDTLFQVGDVLSRST